MDRQFEADTFAAQLATAAKLNQEIGESTTRNAVLQWATAHHEALHKAGLVESLLRVCGQ